MKKLTLAGLAVLSFPLILNAQPLTELVKIVHQTSAGWLIRITDNGVALADGRYIAFDASESAGIAINAVANKVCDFTKSLYLTSQSGQPDGITFMFCFAK